MNCSKCDEELVIGKNYTAARLNKKYYICKSCLSRHKQLWREENRERDRATRRANNHTRRSKLGYNELYPNPFPEHISVDWHHINDVDVVAIPSWLHKKHSHKNRHAHRASLEKYVSIIYD